MGASCFFELNSMAMSTFTYDGVRTRAFSGSGEYRNRPSQTNVKSDGPIPTGSYWIVARESGGLLGGVRDWGGGGDGGVAL